MPAYIVRRLLSGLLMLFAITLVTFAVFRLIPMPPGCLLVPCGPNTITNDAQIRAAEHKLGADRPVPVQYAKFVWRIVRHGTFGASWTGGSIDTSLAPLPITHIFVGSKAPWDEITDSWPQFDELPAPEQMDELFG